jgi:hypothetical protein
MPTAKERAANALMAALEDWAASLGDHVSKANGTRYFPTRSIPGMRRAHDDGALFEELTEWLPDYHGLARQGPDGRRPHGRVRDQGPSVLGGDRGRPERAVGALHQRQRSGDPQPGDGRRPGSSRTPAKVESCSPDPDPEAKAAGRRVSTFDCRGDEPRQARGPRRRSTPRQGKKLRAEVLLPAPERVQIAAPFP